MIFTSKRRPPQSERPVGCYVYEFLIDGCVRYVGKGRDDRPWVHLDEARSTIRARAVGAQRKSSRFARALAAAIGANRETSIRIVQQDLSEVDAYALEAELIATYGLENLCNHTEGGLGITSEVAKKINSCPLKRADAAKKLVAKFADPAFAARRNASFKKRWEDPAELVAHGARVRASWSPERKAAQAERKRLWWANATEEQRRKQGDVARANRAVPGVQEKITAGIRASYQAKRETSGT